MIQGLRALLANYEALRWLKDLALDDERGLPAVHTLLFALELGSFWPHPIDMPKAVLKLLNDLLLHSGLLFLDLL